jgi:hypothetical protein
MSADDITYAAEDLAFEGTPLGDRLDRTALIAETLELTANPNVYARTGAVHVAEASTRLVRSSAYARGQEVRFAPTRMLRLVAVHELSHVAHRRWRPRQPDASHGPEYRAVYLAMVGTCYGGRYVRLLREAFHEMRIPPDPSLIMLYPDRPAIDLDVQEDVSRGVRWL